MGRYPRPRSESSSMLDVLIRGGWVADGTANPRHVIDATGKIVCPGFVDAHSHSDWSLFANPTAESTIRQGVTTEVVGNCGEGFAPFTEHARQHLTGRLSLFGYDGPINWSTFGEYLEVLTRMGTSANHVWLVGHNTLRAAVAVTGETVSEDD